MSRLILAFVVSLLAAGRLAAAPGDGAAAYLLGPRDQIEVNIASYPDLRTTTRLAPDGNVVLPLIGTIALGGLAPADAAAAIAARYAGGGFIKAPSVRVEIVDYQSRKASVLGMVNAQGLIVLDRGYSVAEIIARAGGLAPGAAETAVIVRQQPGGGIERLTVDLGQLTAPGGSGALAEVRAGDVIYVPKAPTFSVIGAVNRAGSYPITAGMTIQQALAAAGDVARIGSRSRLKVQRPAAGGGTTVVAVRPDDLVQPGDVIIVRERLF